MRKYIYDELVRLNDITKYCSVIHKDAILNTMCTNYIYQFIDNIDITYEQKHKLQDLLRKLKHFDYGEQ